jgi:hypothetical protein
MNLQVFLAIIVVGNEKGRKSRRRSKSFASRKTLVKLLNFYSLSDDLKCSRVSKEDGNGMIRVGTDLHNFRALLFVINLTFRAARTTRVDRQIIARQFAVNARELQDKNSNFFFSSPFYDYRKSIKSQAGDDPFQLFRLPARLPKGP